MQIGKHLGWFLILIISFFLVDRTFSYAMSKIVFASNFRYSKTFQGGMNNKYVFVGSSRGVTSFYQPEIEKLTSEKAYNLSDAGLTSGIAKPILNGYLKNNTKPEIVFIEISFLNNVNIDVNVLNNLKLFYSKSEELRDLAKLEVSESYFFQKIFHSYRFNSELFYRILFYLNKDDQTSINRHLIKPNLIEQTIKMDSFDLSLNKVPLVSLKEMIDECDKQDIQVKLILGPYYPAYHSKIKNLDEWIIEAEEFTGKEIYNFSSAIVGDKYFADRLHMNYEGGMAFAKLLNESNLFD